MAWEEENAAAAKAAEKLRLPVLTGTPKQVAWAVTLRQYVYDALTTCIDNIKFDDKYVNKLQDKIANSSDNERTQRYQVSLCEYQKSHSKERWTNFRDWLMNEKTTAEWWIEYSDSLRAGLAWRGLSDLPKALIEKFEEADSNGATFKSAVKSDAGQEVEQECEMREAAEAEMTVQPVEVKHSGTVGIKVDENVVAATYAKNEDFREVVKGLGYKWDAAVRRWEKRITVTSGTAEERAAELGNKLLNAGFSIRISNPETRQAAIEGRYKPEHRRWITRVTTRNGKDCFCIKLTFGGGTYERSKAIHGARYSKPNMLVPASEWAAVEDFASLYDYRLSPGAKELIDDEKATTIIVAPAPAKEAVYTEHDPMSIMQQSSDVLADLVDTD